MHTGSRHAELRGSRPWAAQRPESQRLIDPSAMQEAAGCNMAILGLPLFHGSKGTARRAT
jgi:hypothetical protein